MMRICLRGPYNTYTGYGSDLVGLAAALRKAGHKVMPLATSVMAGLPEEVAMLFAQPVTDKFDVIVNHLPPFDLALPEQLLRHEAPKVAWSMWEQTEFTASHQRGHRQGRNPWRPYDLMLCYDQVTLDAFNAYDPVPRKVLLQGGVEADRWAYVDRDWFGTFRFCMLGELHQRKDPFTAIDAFRELREAGELADAELHLKSSIAGLHPGLEELIPGVRVHNGMWPREQIQRFYRDMHCLISPSRGEGKNLPALEMQLSGAVAMVTNWGGHRNWLHPSYAFPIDYTLEPVGPEDTSRNARASKEHLKQLMVKAYENRSECREMGRRASAAIRQTCSWDAVVERLIRHLRGIGVYG